MYTSFFGAGRTISDKTLIRLEPQPGGTGNGCSG
jgi:hypothetical protein